MLPASKSISNRALAINALTAGKAVLHNVSDCDDTRVMLQWLKKQPEVVDIGAAGTAMRFSTALLTVSEGTHVITGTERMQNRPIAILVDALRELGADIEYVEKTGFPPLRIIGNKRLTGGRVSLPGNVSSQYISALLMIGPTLQNGLVIELTGEIVSLPYINMTITIMQEYGAKATWLTQNTLGVEPGGYKATDYLVENDWSAASYWYEIVALTDDVNAEVRLPNLLKDSLQGDSKGAEVFQLLGVTTTYNDESIVLRKTDCTTKQLNYNFVEMPDLAQTFVVTCCMLDIKFHFTGLQSLKIKETDRINALKVEMAKLGFVLEDKNDSELLWTGVRCTPQADVAIDTYEDHRMAMAFAPATMKFGQLKINNPQVVSKSYPNFWDNLKSFGFEL